jgi:hypothetical protein
MTMTKAELLKLVRAKCLDCGADSPKEVDLCPVTGCSLYTVRFGKDPTKRVLSPEKAAALGERLRKARTKKNPTPTAEEKPNRLTLTSR